MTEDDNDKNIFDTVDNLIDLYENNKDTIRNVMGSRPSLGGGNTEALKSCFVRESKVLITIDVGNDGFDSVGVNHNGDEIEVVLGNQKIEQEVPEDIIMDEAEAKLNNGVLEVDIPRAGGDE